MNEENKTRLIRYFLICLIVCFCITAVFVYKIRELEVQKISFTDKIKSKELEIGIYDQLTYCIKIVMKESRKNNKPASLQDAEKACAKFNKSGE